MGRKALRTPSRAWWKAFLASLASRMDGARAWANPNDDGSLPDRAQAQAATL